MPRICHIGVTARLYAANMKTNYNWLKDLHSQDTKTPDRCMDGEAIYTLYMRDLLKMPDVNFECLSIVDANLKTLFN